MEFLSAYIAKYRSNSDSLKQQLANELEITKKNYDIFEGVSTDLFSDLVYDITKTERAFTEFVDRYNWIGRNKTTYNIAQNDVRNLVGALMQDYLASLLISQLKPFPKLHIFTEVPISFGVYPLWKKGQVSLVNPAERSDLAIGYLLDAGKVEIPPGNWPQPVITKLPKEHSVIPLVTLSSKIRVSQSEFFDWQGREQLMTKGNPHCLSMQVALRKEMDMSIVEVAQAADKFFLLGSGNEGKVTPDPTELSRLVRSINNHLIERMR